MDETRNNGGDVSRGDVPGARAVAGAAVAGTARPDGEPPESASAPCGQAPAGDGPTVAQLQDRWVRAVAELNNLRKRFERQLEAARHAERDRVTAAWLPVLDHLELALQHAQTDPAAIVAGVRAVREQALAVLAELGYHRVEDVGARFDPARHEAAQLVHAPEVEPNTVLGVLRPGYATETALLRPAVVAVAGGRE